jgi:ABC-type multidrug transport system permease subunit
VRGSLRVLRKDLIEFLDGIRGVLLVLVLPTLALVFVGQLNVTATPVRLVVVTAGEKGDKAVAEKLALDETGPFEITRRHAPTVLDPFRVLVETRADLLLDATAEEPSNWDVFTASTEPGRLLTMRQALRRVTAARPGLHAYFPDASDPRRNLLPATITLVICLIPFVVAAPSVIGERENHTLDVLLSARGIGATRLVVGKVMLPVALTLFDLAAMLLLVHLVHGVQVKAGLLAVIGLVLPAILASTALGLAVSALVRSQAQAMLAASIYFLVLLLFSGFIYPLDHATPLVQNLALLLPLTHILPAFRAWMFGGWATVDARVPMTFLLADTLLYGVFAAVAFQRLRRRL